MKVEEYVKELRRQATSFKVLSRVMRKGEPDSKQLMNAAVAKGLAEVCEALAGLSEVSA